MWRLANVYFSDSFHATMTQASQTYSESRYHFRIESKIRSCIATIVESHTRKHSIFVTSTELQTTNASYIHSFLLAFPLPTTFFFFSQFPVKHRFLRSYIIKCYSPSTLRDCALCCFHSIVSVQIRRMHARLVQKIR